VGRKGEKTKTRGAVRLLKGIENNQASCSRYADWVIDKIMGVVVFVDYQIIKGTNRKTCYNYFVSKRLLAKLNHYNEELCGQLELTFFDRAVSFRACWLPSLLEYNHLPNLFSQLQRRLLLSSF
jgi:hypothetical protein